MKLKAKAFAKLNLFLDVLGKRQDGYHDIDSIMQSISLYDEIQITDNGDMEVKITYQDPSFSRENDIILRACEAYFAFSGWKSGLDIYIVKNIPTVAGLGGFSADVAAVLKCLNIISGKNYSDEDMIPLCTSLGADVPFCYSGGTARAGSVGDKLEMLPTLKLNFVLLKEGTKQSTADMYRKLDECHIKPSKKITSMINGIVTDDASSVLNSVYNIFENCWDFSEMKKPFNAFEPDVVFLSGSGPTVVAAFECADEAKLCYDKLLKDGRNVYFATSVSNGNIIE